MGVWQKLRGCLEQRRRRNRKQRRIASARSRLGVSSTSQVTTRAAHSRPRATSSARMAVTQLHKAPSPFFPQQSDPTDAPLGAEQTCSRARRYFRQAFFTQKTRRGPSCGGKQCELRPADGDPDAESTTANIPSPQSADAGALWSHVFPPRAPPRRAGSIASTRAAGQSGPRLVNRQRACQVVTPRKPRAPAGNPVQPAKHPAGGGRGAAGARTFPHRPDGPGHQKRCEGNPPRLANRGRRAPIPPGGPAAPARPI